MAGFMDILGTMMQQGMAQSGGTRMKHALGGRGGLEDLLGGLGQMVHGIALVAIEALVLMHLID